MHDEGPSSEDLERFSGDTAYCPSCGEEIWDLAEFCPACNAHIGGDTRTRTPIDHWWRQKWIGVVVALVLLGFLWWLVF